MEAAGNPTSALQIKREKIKSFPNLTVFPVIALNIFLLKNVMTHT